MTAENETGTAQNETVSFGLFNDLQKEVNDLQIEVDDLKKDREFVNVGRFFAIFVFVVLVILGAVMLRTILFDPDLTVAWSKIMLVGIYSSIVLAVVWAFQRNDYRND